MALKFLNQFIVACLFCQGAYAQADSTRFPFKKYITPTVLTVASVWALQSSVKERQVEIYKNNFSNFGTTADNYVQHLPATAWLAGSFANKHSKDQFAMGLASIIAANGTTRVLKWTFKMPRPNDPTVLTSYPSGHTTQAFVGAAILAKDFKGQSMGIPIVGYGLASSVGAMRMLNNKHWLADVFLGAAIGIGATETVHFLYPLAKKKIQAIRRPR